MNRNFAKSCLTSVILGAVSHVVAADIQGDGSSAEVIDLLFTTTEPVASDNNDNLVSACKIHVRPPGNNTLPPGSRMIGLGDLNNDGLKDLVLGINEFPSETSQHSPADLIVLMGSPGYFYQDNQQAIEEINARTDISIIPVRYREGTGDNPDIVIWGTDENGYYNEVPENNEDTLTAPATDITCAVLNSTFSLNDRREVVFSGPTFCGEKAMSGYVKVKKLHSGG